MSCEGNRHSFLALLQREHGIDEIQLEKRYRAHKARGPQSPEEEILQTFKTRQLFSLMRDKGIKPPTHAANGLPKKDSRTGYAAIYDAIQNEYKGDAFRDRRYNPLRTLNSALKNLKDAQGYDMATGLNANGDNRWGWNYHRRKTPKRGQGAASQTHVWFGGYSSYASLASRPDAGDAQSKRDLFSPESVPEDFLQPDADGLLEDGFDLLGFDKSLHNADGFNIYGIHKDENPSEMDYRNYVGAHYQSPNIVRYRLKKPKKYDVDIEGFAADGFLPRHPKEGDDRDRFGFNRNGFRKGRSWTGYDERGLDQKGRPRKQTPYYDDWGYHRREGLTEPDKKGRRYNLIGWQYDAKTDTCFNPKKPEQKMPHSGSYRYSRTYGKVVMNRSYVPTEDELVERMKNPVIRHAEIAAGGDFARYVPLYDGDQGMLARNSLKVRYIRSKRYAAQNPEGDLMGIRLRCDRCGQFTGARPHVCPKMGNKNIVIFESGIVAEVHPSNGIDYGRSGFEDEVRNTWSGFLKRNLVDTPDFSHFYTIQVSVAEILGITEESRMSVLETPFNPDFDPEYEGGPVAGFSYKTGLDREGYDLSGFNPETGMNRDGSAKDVLLAGKSVFDDMRDKLANKDTTDEADGRLLAGVYSGVASALAGAPRRVVLDEKGGPRDGMFGTNLKGKITAERYPLGKNASLEHNLLAMKAGIYHEIGHEEDTPPEIWSRAMRIAQGQEEVEGLSKQGARKVAELFNIVEDGRMERVQAKRRRGVASILAADSKIQPRWGEETGENIPLEHQLTGMMLYRSLPFFKVRQEVYEQAPPRVRQLFDEIAPLVDRATSGSAEEALFASVEIARKLDQDDEIRKERKKAQKPQKSYRVTAIPQSVQENAKQLSGTPIPAPGWGKKSDKKQDDEQKGTGRKKVPQQDDEKKGDGRKKGPQQDDEQKGAGRKKQEENQQGDGFGSGDGAGGGSDRPKFTPLEPEPDETFFFDVRESTDLISVLLDTARNAAQGTRRAERPDSNEKKAAQQLALPSRSMRTIIQVPTGRSDKKSRVYTPNSAEWGNSLRGRNRNISWDYYDQQAKSVGKRLGQRLSRLKASIKQKRRHQTSGRMDRKRFKRAVGGSRTVYQQNKDIDITSLSVSVSVDMSGSMDSSIMSGELFGAVTAIGAAMETLDAPYSVNAFGSTTHLVKSVADKDFPLETRKFFGLTSLGGTKGATAIASSSLSLENTGTANKIAFVLTDGEFSDSKDVAHELESARKKGIIPFGMYFGTVTGDTKKNLDKLYGAGSWAQIETLDDLPKTAANRIERIYRRILAAS